MVKKSSFLEKLKNRWSSSPVQVVPGAAGTAGPTDGTSRVTPLPEGSLQVGGDRTKLSGRKLTKQEEGLIAINEGFHELAGLMRSMQGKIEGQGDHVSEALGDVHRLPAINDVQVDLLRQMTEQMEKQNHCTSLIATRLADMPKMMSELRDALDRASAIDERTSVTLDQFRGNMDRVHKSMASMVESSAQQADSSSSLLQAQRQHLDGFAQVMNKERDKQVAAVEGIIGNLENVTDEGMRNLRAAQADQSTRLGMLIQEGTRASRGILILLALALAGLVILTAVLIVR